MGNANSSHGSTLITTPWPACRASPEENWHGADGEYPAILRQMEDKSPGVHDDPNLFCSVKVVHEICPSHTNLRPGRELPGMAVVSGNVFDGRLGQRGAIGP